MKIFNLASLIWLLTAARSLGLPQSTVILESATLGNMSQPSSAEIVIVPDQYLAARFHISAPTLIDQVGGLMRPYPSPRPVTIFAAIAEISSQTGFPTSPPSEFEPLAVTNLVLTNEYADWRTPLNVLLPPGDYALIFGSGRFGADGNAVMYRVSPETSQASFFSGVYDLPDGRNDIWLSNPDLERLRFIVTGIVVPEPPPMLTALIAAVATCLVRCRG